MTPQALIELGAGDALVGKLEKLSSDSLFVSFDKLNNTSRLNVSNQYFVSVSDRNEKIRIPCKLVQFDHQLAYFQPLHSRTS